MPGVDAMTDYEKWDQLDLSDDEDGVEVPPNIERGTFFRLLREKRRRERSQKADAAAARAERLAELMLLLEEPAPANGGADRTALLAEMKALEAQVARDRKARKLTYNSIATEGFNRTVRQTTPPWEAMEEGGRGWGPTMESKARGTEARRCACCLCARRAHPACEGAAGMARCRGRRRGVR